MIVKIFTLKNGLEVYENVNAIRIKSKEYNLLILKDYVPMIGEIDGDLEFELADGNKLINSYIKAYYVIENNVFSVLIEGV
ncbi:MAG: hypothetical protein E7159_03255 [Firmicutes bacterium]|jgi:hypothetical protein|nr:hypothetical protein [Bacillota bacterium]